MKERGQILHGTLSFSDRTERALSLPVFVSKQSHAVVSPRSKPTRPAASVDTVYIECTREPHGIPDVRQRAMRMKMQLPWTDAGAS